MMISLFATFNNTLNQLSVSIIIKEPKCNHLLLLELQPKCIQLKPGDEKQLIFQLEDGIDLMPNTLRQLNVIKLNQNESEKLIQLTFYVSAKFREFNSMFV